MPERVSLSLCTDSRRSSSAATTKRKDSRSACSSAPLQLAHYAGTSHYKSLSVGTRRALSLITHIITVPSLKERIVDWKFQCFNYFLFYMYIYIYTCTYSYENFSDEVILEIVTEEASKALQLFEYLRTICENDMADPCKSKVNSHMRMLVLWCQKSERIVRKYTWVIPYVSNLRSRERLLDKANRSRI